MTWKKKILCIFYGNKNRKKQTTKSGFRFCVFKIKNTLPRSNTHPLLERHLCVLNLRGPHFLLHRDTTDARQREMKGGEWVKIR